MSDWFAEQAGVLWMILAALFAICELLVPGVYLTFLALGAAATAVLALVVPDLNPIAQFVSFAAWSTVTVLIGRRWYGSNPLPSPDPDLNNRSARMIGQSATVVDAIIAGSGRVRVGDGEWPAHGPDLSSGTPVLIIAVENGVVHVAPLTNGPNDSARLSPLAH